MKAIGEEFEHKGVFYKAVEFVSCKSCCFTSGANQKCKAVGVEFSCYCGNESLQFAIIPNPNKGQKNCECAQKDCKNKGANYWHRMNKEYFCETCAEIIAELMAEDIALVCSDGKLLVKEL